LVKKSSEGGVFRSCSGCSGSCAAVVLNFRL
jgi:hypothetical protein